MTILATGKVGDSIVVALWSQSGLKCNKLAGEALEGLAEMYDGKRLGGAMGPYSYRDHLSNPVGFVELINMLCGPGNYQIATDEPDKLWPPVPKGALQ